MRFSIRAAAFAAVLGGVLTVPVMAQAASATAAPANGKTAQQQRMTTCNAEAKGKKGAERKAFMSSCLKGESAAGTKQLSSSQQRMKDCNAKAKGKTGDDRKAFMSSCLKAK